MDFTTSFVCVFSWFYVTTVSVCLTRPQALSQICVPKQQSELFLHKRQIDIVWDKSVLSMLTPAGESLHIILLPGTLYTEHELNTP